MAYVHKDYVEVYIAEAVKAFAERYPNMPEGLYGAYKDGLRDGLYGGFFIIAEEAKDAAEALTEKKKIAP